MQIDRVLGNVGVLYVGEYDPSIQYEYINCVTYNGSSYVCVNQNGVTGVEPGTTDDWQLSAKKGDVGPVGPKPVNGVDYNTDEEKEEFKNEVVSTATTEVKQNIETIKEEAIQEFNSNASTKTNEYNSNTTTKLSEYNTNANSKVEEYNSNATQKTNTFNENATTQTEIFNTNASTKTTEFDTNATNKTNAFNENYDEKLADINEASTSIEQERVISDGKYACALKTQVKDAQQAQIYAENDIVNDLVINGVELTQKTREGYNEIQNEVETSSMGGIDITRNSDGSVTLNGTATENITLYYSTKEIILNGTYIFYLYGKNKDNINLQGTENGSDVAYLTYSSASEKYVKRVYDTDTILSAFFSYIAIGKTFNNETFYPMITKGEEVKPYEEYGASPSLDFPSEIQIASEQNITINETNITIPLVNSAIGQYADTIDRENNVQNKVIQELILTGDEDWKLSDANEAGLFKIYADYISNNKMLCNYFKYNNANTDMFNNLNDGEFGLRVYGTDPNQIFFKYLKYGTIDEWKAKLKELYDAGTPVKIYYVAQSPTTNPLPQEVQTALSNFKLYQDLNNIAIDGGSMSFIYNKSLSKTIEEMQDEIQSKDTLIQNLTTRVEALEKAQVDNVGGN